MYCARAPRLSRLAQVSLGTLNALSAYDDGRGGWGVESLRSASSSSSAAAAAAAGRQCLRMLAVGPTYKWPPTFDNFATAGKAKAEERPEAVAAWPCATRA